MRKMSLLRWCTDMGRTLTLDEVVAGAAADVAMSGGGALQLRSLSLADIFALYGEYGAAITRAFADATGGATVADILTSVPGFVPSLIARAAGEPEGVADAASLEPDTQREILEHVTILTLGEDELALPSLIRLATAVIDAEAAVARYSQVFAGLLTNWARMQIEIITLVAQWRDPQAVVESRQ